MFPYRGNFNTLKELRTFQLFLPGWIFRFITSGPVPDRHLVQDRGNLCFLFPIPPLISLPPRCHSRGLQPRRRPVQVRPADSLAGLELGAEWAEEDRGGDRCGTWPRNPDGLPWAPLGPTPAPESPSFPNGRVVSSFRALRAVYHFPIPHSCLVPPPVRNTPPKIACVLVRAWCVHCCTPETYFIML